MPSIIKHEHVRLEHAPGGAESGTTGARCAKSVRLLEVEGTVRALELRCSCGEATVIELDYAEPQEPP